MYLNYLQMKNNILFFLLCSFSFLTVHSQIKYEAGYIIDNTGDRTDVLILNKDWRDNPSEINYKKGESGEVLTVGVEEVKEFGIGNSSRYKSFLVSIDQSKDQTNALGTSAEPDFLKKRVFLKQLLAGKTALYSYREGVLTRFFYATDEQNPEALVFKRYKKDNRIAENNSFRQQLYTNLNCRSLSADAFRKIEYSEDDLVEFFADYNSCENSDFNIIEDETPGGKFNFYLKGGMLFSSIAVERGLEAKDADFSFDPGFVLGVEAEYVMPFNRNKWSLLLESTYQSHAKEGQLVNNTNFEFNDAYLTLDMTFISVAGGVRHYLFLNESSKFFVNAGVAFDFPLNTELSLDRGEKYQMKAELDDFTTQAYFLGGVGFNYANRFSAEVRYYSSKKTTGERTVPDNYMLQWDAGITSFAVILAYRFL